MPETADDRRWNELRQGWLNQVKTFLTSKEDGDPTLSAFLDYAALITEEDVSNTDADRVTMMTLHNAKGKEFPVVIIIGVEDGNIPDWRNRDDPEALEEERRVFYVGMARAKDRLYLTSVTMRDDNRRRAPSRFVYQLPAQHIVRHQAQTADPQASPGDWNA